MKVEHSAAFVRRRHQLGNRHPHQVNYRMVHVLFPLGHLGSAVLKELQIGLHQRDPLCWRNAIPAIVAPGELTHAVQFHAAMHGRLETRPALRLEGIGGGRGSKSIARWSRVEISVVKSPSALMSRTPVRWQDK